MKKIFFNIGFCVIFLTVLIAPLAILITCYPNENAGLLDFLWYGFLILCSISYSITLYYMYQNYDDMENRLKRIIQENKENNKNISITIENTNEIIDKLIL